MSAGKASLNITTTGTWQQVTPSTPGAGLFWTTNVNFANAGTGTSQVKLAVSTSTTAAGIGAADIYVPGKTLNPNDEYERTAILLMAGEYLWAEVSAANVAVRANWTEGAA